MPLPTVPGPWSFYRLGPTREKELFKRHRDTYDGVVVPAHIASYYCGFCAEFIGTLKKPYFIDPITYIFALNPTLIRRFVKDKDSGRTIREGGRKKKGDIKRSYLKLVERHYGSIIKEAVDERRALRVSDFSDRARVDELVERVASFQRETLSALPDKYRKYEKYAARTDKSIAFSKNLPMFLVPPYFLTDSVAPRSWHAVNLDLARRTKGIAGDLPVFAVILSAVDTLARDANQIAAEYSKLGVDGFLIWVDGLTVDPGIATLQVVRNLVASLAKAKKPIISLYGDAASLVLSYFGLTGFCCGICYGERKSGDQDVDIEGPIPPRYYIERLKQKMQTETFRRIPRNAYPDLVCSCDICTRKPDPATLDDTESREHFMLVRAKEIAAIRDGMSAKAFASSLRKAYDQYGAEPLFGPVTRLLNWSNLLRAGAGVSP